jgi:hypothetical protein
MTAQIDAPLVFVVCGMIGAALAALGLLHPTIRHLDKFFAPTFRYFAC